MLRHRAPREALALAAALSLALLGCGQPTGSGSTGTGSTSANATGSTSASTSSSAGATGSTGAGSTGSASTGSSSTGGYVYCGADTCAGCCDPNGKCELPDATHCGLDGAACATCASGLSCEAGQCAQAPTGSSGTGTTGATSAGSTTGGNCCLTLGCSGACDPVACTCLSGTSGGSTGAPDAGDICTSQHCIIYAETVHTLYQVDPSPPNAISELCDFGGAIHGDAGVNDIAVQRDGTLWGITKTDLYRVDPNTCAGTHVSALAQSAGGFNCLTFTNQDTLLAADQAGQVLTINTATGAVANAGSFGGNYGCSGDILATADGTLYATAKTITGTHGNDMLVTLDPANGYHATRVSSSDLGYRSVFGLGFWGGTLYGFDTDGHVLSIDPVTGVGTLLHTETDAVFYGAGTTPLAPTTHPTH